MAERPIRKCNLCDDTGYKDYAGFGMDPCDHLRPTPAADTEKLVPANPAALESSIASVDEFMDSDDGHMLTPEHGESIMLCMHELKRLRSLPAPAADEVEAVDRIAAAHFLRSPGHPFDALWADAVERGERDEHILVKAFAQHRHAAIAALQSRSAEPVQDRHELPIMRTAFRTTLSGSGKYSMQFEFRDLETLHAADCEWLTFRKEIECSIGAADAGDTSTAAIATDAAEPAGEEPVMVPRHATDEMMVAGLYHMPDGVEWSDLFTAWHAMFDTIAQDGGMTTQLPATQTNPERQFIIGQRVTKRKGSSWTGRVVGFYSTALTPIGYSVESETETGSVQIYPEAALTAAPLKEGK